MTRVCWDVGMASDVTAPDIMYVIGRDYHPLMCIRCRSVALRMVCTTNVATCMAPDAIKTKD